MRTGSIAHLAMDREVLNRYLLAHALYMIIKSALGCPDESGSSTRWVLSSVRDLNPSADALQVCRKRHFMDHHGEGYEGSAGSEAPCMHGNSLDGNREALNLATVDCAGVRMENPKGVRP